MFSYEGSATLLLPNLFKNSFVAIGIYAGFYSIALQQAGANIQARMANWTSVESSDLALKHGAFNLV